MPEEQSPTGSTGPQTGPGDPPLGMSPPSGGLAPEPEKKPPLERKGDAPPNFPKAAPSRAQNEGRTGDGPGVAEGLGPEGDENNIGAPTYFLTEMARAGENNPGAMMRIWQVAGGDGAGGEPGGGQFIVVKRSNNDVTGVGLVELDEGMPRQEAMDRVRRCFDSVAVLV